jgi:subtilisin-like proprotein convertase family protein
MQAPEFWKNLIPGRNARRLLIGGLVLLLTLALTVSVWAVVFPNAPQTTKTRRTAGPQLPSVVFPNANPITINDGVTSSPASLYPSNIAVSGMTGTITNMTVTLNNINHTFVPDIDILLVAPGGANMIIFSDVGSGIDTTNVTINLDDAAATSLTAANLVSGTFKPTNITAGDTFPAPAPAASANTTFASAFGGTDPNGTWSLYVVDDVSLDVGSIGNGWSMTIATSGSPATTFSNEAAILIGDSGKGRATPYASTITVSGLTGAITDVNVTLTGFNHTFPDDVDILLVGPTGKRIVLMSDTGGSNVLSGVNITFDDAAAAGLPDSTAIATGSFKPTNIGTADPFPDVLPSGQIAGGEAFPSGTTAGPCTLASSFNGTDPNGTWSLYVVDDAGGSTGTITGGWSLDITAGGVFGAKRFTNADFDGDGKADVSLWSPSTHNWSIRNSSTYANRVQLDWGNGSLGDVAVPGDYDGDKKTDIAIFRPSEGNWYIIPSSTGTPIIKNWGLPGDTPVPEDYDGDGKTDVAVWRGSQGNWYILRSSTNTGRVVGWGTSGDVPVRGHFEGTNGADFTVFRPAEGNWYILNNAGSSARIVNWGDASDKLVPGDYDADGKTDVAVWRPSNSVWYVLQSSTGTALLRSWGASTDTPVPGDYDGDARTDFVVFRPGNSNWYILSSGTTTNGLRLDTLGSSGDVPAASTY